MVAEIDIARIVVKYLEQQGWDVYQEVQGYGGRADIVGISEPVVRVVEVKTSFTAALIDQAWCWQPDAHYVHVAVPKEKYRAHSKGRDVRGRRVLSQFCVEHGIGVLLVDHHGWGAEKDVRVVEERPAKLNRKAIAGLRSRVRPEHKTWGAAGNAQNQYWTPWKGTCEEWRLYVEKNPGCTIKEIIEKAGHHYRADTTARSCMTKYIRDGIIPGIVANYDERAIRLFPAYPKEIEHSNRARRGRPPAESTGDSNGL